MYICLHFNNFASKICCFFYDRINNIINFRGVLLKLSQVCILMLDKDECVLAEAEDIIEQISVEAKYEGFTDEEQLLNRLYADSVGVDAVVIPSDLKSSDSISFASAIAEKFSDTEIIFSTLPCEAKEIERLFLSGYKLRPFAVIVKPLNKTVLTPIINSLIEAKSVKRNAIMVSAGRTHTLYRTADIIMVKSEKRKIRVLTKDSQACIYGQIRKIRQRLPDYFVMPHASYLINVNYIKVVEGDNIFLEDGTKIPISRGRRHDFVTQLKQASSWVGGAY